MTPTDRKLEVEKAAKEVAREYLYRLAIPVIEEEDHLTELILAFALSQIDKAVEECVVIANAAKYYSYPPHQHPERIADEIRALK